MKTNNEQIKIGNREYTVTGSVACGPLSAELMQKNGWLPSVFQLEGKRGAVWMAHKSATTGEYSLTTNLRF